MMRGHQHTAIFLMKEAQRKMECAWKLEDLKEVVKKWKTDTDI